MPGRYRRPVTAQQQAKAADNRDAKLAALHQTLEAGVAELASGPQWQAWLAVAARFHHYSFGNTLLIAAQRPGATQVAGYSLWQQLGRQVTKGEKGLAILAPVISRSSPQRDDGGRSADAAAATPPASAASPTPPVARTDPADDGGRGGRSVVGFRPAYVWDLSQTTGEPLPVPPMPVLLSGQAPAGLWDALAGQVAEAGFTVQREPAGGEANGYTNFLSRTVVVRTDVDDAQAVKTLSHELGHVLMHQPEQQTTRLACRGQIEVEAESLAYLISADRGLDTTGYTFAYVAHWATATDDPAAVVRATGARVLSCAHGVLEKVTQHLADTPPTALTTDAQHLADRVAAGAAAAAAARAAATTPPAAPEAAALDRLAAAMTAATAFYAEQATGSWVPDYLADRLGQAPDPARYGYAPAGPAALTIHLRAAGFTDAEITGAGLATARRDGRLVDLMRDRALFPIRATGSGGGAEQVVGFTARRNPSQDDAAGVDGPKYLNTPTTALYRKGEHLLGLAEHRSALIDGATAVLVEGPLDALAVDTVSTRDRPMVGLAVLGTAVTDLQSRLLPGDGARVVVALDADPAGQRATARTYSLLTARQLDPTMAALPAGTDPAQALRDLGSDRLRNAITMAEPMTRQLAVRALVGQVLDDPHARGLAAKMAARVIVQARPDTWEREIIAVAASTGIDPATLRPAVVDRLEEGSSDGPLAQLAGRDRRDDLDRGQSVQATAVQLSRLGASTDAAANPAPRKPADELVHGPLALGVAALRR